MTDTIKIEKYTKSGGFTVVPNILVDDGLKVLSPTAFKMLVLIIRKTIGFHRPNAKLSVRYASDLAKMTPKTVRKALDELVEYSMVIKDTSGTTHRYSLNPDYEIGVPVKKKANGRRKKATSTIPHTHPVCAIFHKRTRRHMPITWRERAVEVVGEEETDLEHWDKTVDHWVGKGWNPTNIKGMLDVYVSGFSGTMSPKLSVREPEVFF